ncbi:MAG: hypothetical protein HON23_05515 [Rickettsiales bacterium]|nr:hypothetical protein [Rickettsiales bacterium]
MEKGEFVLSIKKAFIGLAKFDKFQTLPNYRGERPSEYYDFKYVTELDSEKHPVYIDTPQKKSMDRVLDILELCSRFITDFDVAGFESVDDIKSVTDLEDRVYEVIWKHVKSQDNSKTLADELKSEPATVLLKSSNRQAMVQRREVYILFYLVKDHCPDSSLKSKFHFDRKGLWPASPEDQRGEDLRVDLQKVIDHAKPPARAEDIDQEGRLSTEGGNGRSGVVPTGNSANFLSSTPASGFALGGLVSTARTTARPGSGGSGNSQSHTSSSLAPSPRIGVGAGNASSPVSLGGGSSSSSDLLEKLSRISREVEEAKSTAAHNLDVQRQAFDSQMQIVTREAKAGQTRNAQLLQEAQAQHAIEIRRQLVALQSISEDNVRVNEDKLEGERHRSQNALEEEMRKTAEALSKGATEANTALAKSVDEYRREFQATIAQMQGEQAGVLQAVEQKGQEDLAGAERNRAAAEKHFAQQIQALGKDGNAKAEEARSQQEELTRQIRALEASITHLSDPAVGAAANPAPTRILSPSLTPSTSPNIAFDVKAVLKAQKDKFNEDGFLKDLSQIIGALNKNHTKADLYTLFSEVYEQGLKATDRDYSLVFERVKHSAKASRKFIEQFVILHVQKDEALDDIFGFIQKFQSNAEFYTDLLDHAVSCSMNRGDYSQVALDHKELFLGYFKEAERGGNISGAMPAYNAIHQEERVKFDKFFEKRSPDAFDKFQNGSNLHNSRSTSSRIGKSRDESFSDNKPKIDQSYDVPVPQTRENKGAYIEKPRVISTKEAAAVSIMTASSISLIVLVTAATTLATAGAGIIALAAVAAACKGYNYSAESTIQKQSVGSIGISK